MKNKEIQKVVTRSNGLDIIRFLAVLFVIGVHFFLYNHFYEAKMEGLSMFIMTGMRWLFYTCVPLFIILTGYLKGNKKPNKEHYHSIVPILSSYLLISILAILVKKFIFHTDRSYGSLLMGIFNFTTIDYAWYVNMYIGLFLLIPFLNILYKNIDTKRNKQILLISLAALVGLPSIFNAITIGNVHLNLVPSWWTMLYPILYYFIGSYIKEYQIHLSKVVGALSIVFLLFFETVCSFFYSQGKVFDPFLFDGYNALPTVMLATLIFIFFYQMHIKWKPLRIMVTDFSKLSFDVYLISCLADFYFYTKFAKQLGTATKAFPYLFLFVPGIFILCYIVVFIKRCILNGLKELKNSGNV